MANTYHQIYLQTVFAVKYRNAVIDKKWRSQLLGGAHGGELKVETKEGEGSEFVIHLPVS